MMVMNDITIIIEAKKFFAFTLAEVLITLGIIGVVAALTIPTLISNHRKKVYVTQLKKSVNTISNGLRLALAKEEVDNLSNTNLGNHISHSQHADILDTYIDQYFNVIEKKGWSSENSKSYKLLPNGSENYMNNCYFITLTDGSELCFYSSLPDYYYVYFDINGYNKLPNTAGVDFFGIIFNENGLISASDDGNALNRCTGNHSGAPYECFVRVLQDNWEITYY